MNTRAKEALVKESKQRSSIKDAKGELDKIVASYQENSQSMAAP